MLIKSLVSMKQKKVTQSLITMKNKSTPQTQSQILLVTFFYLLLKLFTQKLNSQINPFEISH